MKIHKTLKAPESARRLVLIITSSIFLVEMFNMWLLNRLPQLSPFNGASLDALVLILFLAPVLFFFILRPFPLPARAQHFIYSFQPHKTLNLSVDAQTRRSIGAAGRFW